MDPRNIPFYQLKSKVTKQGGPLRIWPLISLLPSIKLRTTLPPIIANSGG